MQRSMLGLTWCLPACVQAKAGVCAAQLGDAHLSREYLAALQEADPAYMPDLFLDSADLLMAAGVADQATPAAVVNVP